MGVSHFARACLLCAALRQAWQCTGVGSGKFAQQRSEDDSAVIMLLLLLLLKMYARARETCPPDRGGDGEIPSDGGAWERRDRGSWGRGADSLASFEVQVPLPHSGSRRRLCPALEGKRRKHVPAHHQASIQERRMHRRVMQLGWRGCFSLTAGRVMHEVGMQLQG